MCRDVAEGKKLVQATFAIEWHSYENDDLADNADPSPTHDEGWYVYLEGHGEIGPDYFGPGYATADEALAAVKRWAEDRGFAYEPPSIRFTLGKWVDL